MRVKVKENVGSARRRGEHWGWGTRSPGAVGHRKTAQ